MGAAFGHAADSGALGRLSLADALNRAPLMGPMRLAAMLGQKEQVFSLAVIALAAKLARVDGPVNRLEIDAFKRLFRVPPEAARDVGRLFDQARDTPADFAPYARQLAESFADHAGVREDVLAALFTIARADGAVNTTELDMLARIGQVLGVSSAGWTRAKTGAARSDSTDEDPYAVLGVARATPDAAIRTAWKNLMRENHPDSLASRGVPQEFIDSAHAKVARINAAWDRVKRERGL